MFKPGEKVICEDVSGPFMWHLTEGKTYTIEWVRGADIKLVGVDDSSKLWRFKPLPSTPDSGGGNGGVA